MFDFLSLNTQISALAILVVIASATFGFTYFQVRRGKAQTA